VCGCYEPFTPADHRACTKSRAGARRAATEMGPDVKTRIVLAGPWADVAVAEALLGSAVPAARTDERASSPPRIVELGDRALARADYCLAALGWRRGATGAVEPGEPTASLPEPALLAEMVGEIASLIGRVPAGEVNLATVMARALARVRGRTAEPARLRRDHSIGDARSDRLDRPFVGHFALERHELRHRRFDGTMSPTLERLVFASGDAVTVLPFDPARDRVLLIEQFRAGPFARRDAVPWCLEAIAGRCDADESLEETARREAEEEAGLQLGRLERILGYYPTPAVAAEFITGFIGEADLPEAQGFYGLDTEHEDIRAFTLPREEAEAAVASGEVNNAPLALSILWLAANADRLRRAWSAA
jgi:nudix-type nucleoside diphosphatase (YffH/AdpP family)